MNQANADHAQAAREAEARRLLLDVEAAALPRAPWLHERQSPSAADLIRFGLWRATAGEADDATLLAALALLPAARAEIDQVEAGVLFLARSQGLSWPRISRALGLASAQAAQQRFERVSGRAERHGRGG